MNLNINPKVKIGAGIVLVGGGVFELVNATKATGMKKAIHYVAAGGLLFSGVALVKNGWTQNSANNKLNPAGDNKIKHTTIGDDAKKIITDVANELKKPIEKTNNSTTRSQEAAQPVVSNQTEVTNNHINAVGESQTTQSQRQTKPSPKVVGKINPEKLDWAKNKKEQIKNRINQLMTKLKGINTRTFDGHQQSLGIKNDIALLTAQHRLVGTGNNFA